MNFELDDWAPTSLVQWLDRKIRTPWLSQTGLLAWLSDVVTYLKRDREISLSQLMRCKFILARKLSKKIHALRQAEREKVYQARHDAHVEVSFKQGFTFFDEVYAGVPKYRGTYRFKKHSMRPDGVPVFGSKKVDGEE